jgi:hypothetical protein
MLSAGWSRLLRQIPVKDQDGLMLQTINRTEIAVQLFLRLDPDFLIIKGRLAGSQEAGRVFFVPYEQIDHIGFYRAVKEADFNEMFAGLDVPEAPVASAPPDPTAVDANGSKASPPLKSAVLERFRSRSSATIIVPSPLGPLGRPGVGSNPELRSNDQKAD